LHFNSAFLGLLDTFFTERRINMILMKPYFSPLVVKIVLLFVHGFHFVPYNVEIGLAMSDEVKHIYKVQIKIRRQEI